jgi:gluconokinase
MHAGIPLTDDDRWPWLRSLADWMAERAADGQSTVVACSALRRSYREVLSQGPPSVTFVHLDGSIGTIRRRLSRRRGHYMPASLLPSQLATLEPLEPDEPGVEVASEGSAADVLRRALDALHLAARETSEGASCPSGG